MSEHNNNESISMLPPTVGEVVDGKVVWRHLDDRNFQFLGYFLSCHLVIEHHLDNFLARSVPTLDWPKAQITFANKVLLISKLELIGKCDEKVDCIPPLKCLNTLRNRVSHNLDFELTDDDLLPIRYFVKVQNGTEITDKVNLLRLFTTIICAFFGSFVGANILASHLRTQGRFPTQADADQLTQEIIRDWKLNW